MISLPSGLHPAVLGAASGIVAIVLASRRERPSDAERAFRLQLLATPPGDRSTRALRQTLLAPVALVLYGFTMPWLLLEYYVLPYQLGAGTAIDGGLNWQEPEPWIAFGAAALYIPLGLLAGLLVFRRYRPVQADFVPSGNDL